MKCNCETCKSVRRLGEYVIWTANGSYHRVGFVSNNCANARVGQIH
jgi:hypothetical protein